MANALSPHRRGVNLFDSFRQEMDNLCQSFEGDVESAPRGVAAWTPRVDVEETEQGFHIRADLPGVDPKDVEIHFRDHVLTIRGAKEDKNEEKSGSFHRVERYVGQFYRSITLPAGTDADQMTAVGAHGTITITLPKKAGAQPRKNHPTAEGMNCVVCVEGVRRW